MTKEKITIVNKKMNKAEKPCGCRERERERESSSLGNESSALYLARLILASMQESMQNGVKNQRYVNNNKKFQDKFTNSFFEAYTRSVGYIVMLKNRLTILNCRSIFRVFKMLANTS